MSKKNGGNGKSPVSLDTLTEFYHELIKPQFDRLNDKIDLISGDVQEIKQDTQELKVRVNHLEDQFDGLKAEFSNVPSRKEFNDLKSEVRSISS